KQTSQAAKEEMPVFRDKGYSDTIYPDAPSPFTEDAKLEDEAVFLWPTALLVPNKRLWQIEKLHYGKKKLSNSKK
ncbi:MAG: hypothetical protein N3A69_02795, partial [Leptospiraceae bacterium]|nr:hypothetical protein [Leptospiraceae bacterium]